MPTRIVRWGGIVAGFSAVTLAAVLSVAAVGDVTYAQVFSTPVDCPGGGAGTCRKEVYDLADRLWGPGYDKTEVLQMDCWQRQKDRNKDGKIEPDTADEVIAGWDANKDGQLTAGEWVKETLWRCDACFRTTGLTDEQYRDAVLAGEPIIAMPVEDEDGTQGTVECLQLRRIGLAATARRNDLNAITQAAYTEDRDLSWRIHIERRNPLTSWGQLEISRQPIVTVSPAQFRIDHGAGLIADDAALWLVE